MSQTPLLPNEQSILASDNGTLVLTSLRVKFEATNGSGSAYTSIPLPKVAACSVTTRKYPLFLAIAALASLAAIAGRGGDGTVGGVVAAAVLVGLYYWIRPGQIEVIADSGTRIAVPTKGLGHEDIRRFVEAVALEVSKQK